MRRLRLLGSISFLALPILLLLLIGMMACAGPRGTWSDAPLILISVDTLRSDRLPVYGYDRVATPAIDGLARQGLVFDHAFSHVPLTLPSHLSIFTGLLPHRHGVRANVGYSPELGDLPHLPRLLSDRGYATGGAVSAVPLARRSGFGDDFDFFDDDDGFDEEGLFQRPGLATLQAALPWLRDAAAGEAPFFFFFHLFEPHQSLIPEAAYTEGASSYDGEVVHADQVVGALLEELRRLGVYDEAIILLLSDHGEGLGDHGETEHGMLLYREALQVPWIVKLPNNAEAGRRIPDPVGLTDVLPTVLELLGLDIPAELDGISRRAAMLGDGPSGQGDREDGTAPSRPILAETLYPRLEMGWSELYSVIDDGHHLIDGPSPELYRRLDDPAQLRPLPLDGEDTRRVFSRLRQEIERSGASFEPAGGVDEESSAALASLGYVGASSSPEDPTISPMERIAVYELYRRGQKAVLDENWSAAESLLKETVAADPGILDAWLLLGRSLQRQERPQEALDAYLIGGPRSDRAMEIASEVAVLCERLGKQRDCPSWLGSFVEARPSTPGLLYLLAQSQRLAGRLDDALLTAEAAVEAAPDDPDAHYVRGTVRAATGRIDDAVLDLRRAVEQSEEKHVPAMVDLAILLYDRGAVEDQEEARRLLGLVRFQAPDEPAVRAALRHVGLE